MSSLYNANMRKVGFIGSEPFSNPSTKVCGHCRYIKLFARRNERQVKKVIKRLVDQGIIFPSDSYNWRINFPDKSGKLQKLYIEI